MTAPDMRMSIYHANEAERWLGLDIPSDPGTLATAQVHATLAVAFATLEHDSFRKDVEKAFDLLGGMWSWYDPSITAEPSTPGGLNDNSWYIQAGRILRQAVGRPARNPTEREAQR